METQTKRINVVTTAYEGGEPFPEASSYPEYVAEQLAERFGVPVDCSEGQSTRVFLYGFDDEVGRDFEHEISSLVKVDLWDEFCDHGYKAYTNA